MKKNSKFLPKFEKLHVVWAEIKKSYWVPAQIEDYKLKNKKYIVRLYLSEELKFLPESKLIHYVYNPYPKDQNLPKFVEDAKTAADEHLRTSKITCNYQEKLNILSDNNCKNCEKNSIISSKKIFTEERKYKLTNKKRHRTKIMENTQEESKSEHFKESKNIKNYTESEEKSVQLNNKDESNSICNLNSNINNNLLVINIRDCFLNPFESLLESLDHTYLELKTKIDTLNRTIEYFISENYSQPSSNDKVFAILIDKIMIYIDKTYCKQSVGKLISLLGSKLNIEIDEKVYSDENKLKILHDLLKIRETQINLN